MELYHGWDRLVEKSTPSPGLKKNTGSLIEINLKLMKFIQTTGASAKLHHVPPHPFHSSTNGL